MKKVTFMNGDEVRYKDLEIDPRANIATAFTFYEGSRPIPMETIRTIENEPDPFPQVPAREVQR